MEQISAMKREKIFESVNVKYHNVANPRLIPVLTETEVSPVSAEKLTSDPFSYEFSLFPEDPTMKFGVLEINIADTPMLTGHQVLDTNNDISGSMGDICSDGKSKMQHVVHTLKNIVSAIVKSDGASVTMATYGFDNKVDEIFPGTKITQDNEATLRKKMDELNPRNGTDIYNALEQQAGRAAKRREETPNVRQTNITLTDGQANEGKSTKYSDMATQVADKCTNIFIGFGGDHNALGLQQLADARPNGSYFYVAEIEKAGLVFGEVIHQMLYTALVNVTIEIENGEIYDYKTNKWQTTLQISSIVSEAKKTYHLRSKTPKITYVNIRAQSLVHDDQEASILDLDDLISHDAEGEIVNLTKHMFRQRTQELMFKAHNHNKRGQDAYENRWTSEQYTAYNEAFKPIRKELVDFCKFMQQYAKENSLETDDFLGSLIADLTVIAKTFGGARSVLYTASKCNSQGRQTSNNTNYIDPNDLFVRRQRPCHLRMMRRQNALGPFHDDFDATQSDGEDDGLNDLQPTPYLSRNVTRTYTTPRQMTIMRSLTGEEQGGELDEIAEHAVGVIITNVPLPDQFPPIAPTKEEELSI